MMNADFSVMKRVSLVVDIQAAEMENIHACSDDERLFWVLITRKSRIQTYLT